MQIYLDKVKAIVDFLPLIVAALAILWAGFVFMDYIYEQCYCRFFNISSLVKKEYKTAFHPKYIIDILLYGIIVYGLSLLNINVGEKISLIILLWTIFLVSIFCILSDCVLDNCLKKIEQSESVSKEDGKRYRKYQSRKYKVIKYALMIASLMLLSYLMPIIYKSPSLTFIIVFFGLVIFYHFKNDSFVYWFSKIMGYDGFLTYTIDHLNVVTKDNKQFVILLPNFRISNDHIVACRVLFLKTNNGLTYAMFNTHETKVFAYDEELDVIRYEPDFYYRISYGDGFDGFSDESMALCVKYIERSSGKNVELYYSENKWKLIDEINYKEIKNSDDGKQGLDKTNDSSCSKAPSANQKKGNREKGKH